MPVAVLALKVFRLLPLKVKVTSSFPVTFNLVRSEFALIVKALTPEPDVTVPAVETLIVSTPGAVIVPAVTTAASLCLPKLTFSVFAVPAREAFKILAVRLPVPFPPSNVTVEASASLSSITAALTAPNVAALTLPALETSNVPAVVISF